MTDGDGDFLNHEFGVGGDNSSAEDFVFSVGEEFNEAEAEVGSVRSGN